MKSSRGPSKRQATDQARYQRCIKFGLPGQGQLVPCTPDLELGDKLSPPPFTKAFGQELDAALVQYRANS